MKVLLPITYLGSIDYYAAWAQADEVIIEKFESYPKQTLRNRCTVYGANGPMDLTIPIIHGKNKLISSVQVDNAANWRNQHWQALLSGYKSSPFFTYFEAELETFYKSSGEKLFDELVSLNSVIVKLLGLKTSYTFTNDFQKEHPDDVLDLRDRFKPSKHPQLFKQPTYYQVFADKHGFKSNLSIIDLLCNEGRNSVSLLKQVELSPQ